MLDQLGYTHSCFWNNRFGDRNEYICDEGNEAKKIGYEISILFSFLYYFASP